MIYALFVIQIILLVIGLGVGYLFLIKANSQDSRLKNIGEILGWIIIAVTIFLTICNFFYSITIFNNYTKKAYCPVSGNTTTEQQAIQQGNAPDASQVNENPQENPIPPVNENKPIKSDNDGHD